MSIISLFRIDQTVLDGHTRSFNPAFSLAQKILRDGLGMELVEARAKGTGFGVSTAAKKGGKKGKDSESENEDGTVKAKKFFPSKTYVLRSNLDPRIVAQAANVVEGETFEEDDATPPEATSAKNKAWAQDDGVLLNWKKSDQLQHLGILQVILSLILVSGRALADSLFHFLSSVVS